MIGYFENMEHALAGGHQIGPDFMSFGENFKDDRGTLIPVEIVTTKNSDGINVKCAKLLNVEETIKTALDKTHESTEEHFKQFTGHEQALSFNSQLI